MRKAERILKKCNAFYQLVSKANLAAATRALELSEMGEIAGGGEAAAAEAAARAAAELAAQRAAAGESAGTKRVGPAAEPIIELDLTRAPGGQALPAPSAPSLRWDPKLKKTIDPTEQLTDAKGNIKPGKEKAYAEAVKNFDQAAAIKELTLGERQSAQIVRDKAFSDFKGRIQSIIEQLKSPEAAVIEGVSGLKDLALNNPKKFFKYCAVVTGVGALFYINTGKKPSASDKTTQSVLNKGIGSLTGSLPDSVLGFTVAGELDSLSSKISRIKTQSEESKKIIPDTIRSLSRLSELIKRADTPPDFNSGTSLQSYGSLNRDITAAGSAVVTNLKSLSELASKTNNPQFSKECNRVAMMVADYSSALIGARSGVENVGEI